MEGEMDLQSEGFSSLSLKLRSSNRLKNDMLME